MLFCPECRGEFHDWVEVCPDCNVALVEKLLPLPERKKRGEPMVHIASAPNEMIAGMWSGILEEQGIHCLVKRRDDFRTGRYPTAYERREFYVLASKAKQAKEILTPFLDSNG